MYHPTTRVLTVLELLQSRREMSGPELAARLEVHIRTVRRYITMLQELGIPVETVRGRHGAYRLRPGFKLPPLMFTDDEALALVLGLLAARQLGLAATAPAVEGALAKVERVLPAPLRERVRAVQETLVLASGIEGIAAQSEALLTLSAAAQQHRRVLLRYRSFDGRESERHLDPYALVCRAGRWYVAGYCHLRREVRIFRLDRALSVEPRDETFAPPADFDALAAVERGIANVPLTWRVEALLAAPLEEARRWIPAALGTLEEAPGGVLFRCWGGSLGWIARFLAGFDCGVTVLHPPELRDELRRLAARATEIAEQSFTTEDTEFRTEDMETSGAEDGAPGVAL